MIEFDDAFKRFTELSNIVEEKLTGFKDTVIAGKVPSQDEIKELGDLMFNLNVRYSEIKSIIDSDIQEGKADSEDLSVFEYAEIYENERKEVLLHQFEEFKKLLEEFLSVKSSIQSYGDALKPFQDQTSELLSSLEHESDELKLRDVEVEQEDKRTFLEALNVQDFDSPQGIALLDKLSSAYPTKVHQGLMLKKYYLPERNTELRSNTEETIEQNNDMSKASNSTDLDTSGSCDTDGDEPLRNSSDDAPATTEMGKPQHQKSEEEQGFISTAHEQKAQRLFAINKIKRQKANATAFKKELRTMPKGVLVLLPMLTNFGVLSRSQIRYFCSYADVGSDLLAKDKLDSVLHVLTAKSIIAAFQLADDEDTAYCLTTYGNSLLHKESIVSMRSGERSFWMLTFGRHEVFSDGAIDKAKLDFTLRQNNMLLDYLSCVKKLYGEDGYERIQGSINWQDDHYSVIVPWGYEEYTCQLMDSQAEATSSAREVLYVSTNNDIEPQSINEGTTAFLASNALIRKWANKWISLENGIQQPLGNEDNTQQKEAAKAFRGDSSEPDKSKSGKDSMQIEPDENDSKKADERQSADIDDTRDSANAYASIDEGLVSLANNDSSLSVMQPASSRDLAKAMLESPVRPTDGEFVKLASALLAEQGEAQINSSDYSNLATAIALLKAASFIEDNTQCANTYLRTILGTTIPLSDFRNTGEDLIRVFPEYNKNYESSMLAAYCLAMLSPQQPYDYTLRQTFANCLSNFEELFPSFSCLKQLFHELNKIWDISPEGFSESVLSLLGDQAKKSNRLKQIKNQAKSLQTEPKFKTKLNGLFEFSNACFGKDSELKLCMEILSENNRDDQDYIRGVLAEYCGSDTTSLQLSEEAIGTKVDEEWHAASSGKSAHRVRRLDHFARRQAVDAFADRLLLMKKWLEYDESKLDEDTLQKLRNLRDVILDNIRDSVPMVREVPVEHKPIILLWMLQEMQDRLHGESNESRIFSDFLRTGIVSLDDKGFPILLESLSTVKYCEPWRNILKHICSPFVDFQKASSDISAVESSVFDNLHQLEMIGKHLEDDSHNFIISGTQLQEAIAAADDATEKFEDKLEIAYAYNQINEVQKESLAGTVLAYKDHFYELKDFGCWRQFLCALGSQVNDMASVQQRALENQISACRDRLNHGEKSPLLDEAERLLTEEKNYAVVEEYLNRFDQGDRDVTDDLAARLHDPDNFSEFISDEVFRPLYDACISAKSSNFASFSTSYIKSKFPSEWTDRQKRDSEQFIKAWPISSKRSTTERLIDLFILLGVDAQSAKLVSSTKRRDLYQLSAKASAKNLSDYRHPIASFGTQMKSPLNVIVMYGNRTPQEIIDTIADERGIAGLSVVLINYPVTLAARRQVAELFHTSTTGQKSFLLVDQVLALYLALHQATERLPLMLKCSLPFTSYQPFVRDGGSTADEMFCGRTKELKTITDPSGACIVYGGRQLGKTALLERAESLCSRPATGEYAVYVSILECRTEQMVAEKTFSAFANKTSLPISPCKTFNELCGEIRLLLKDGIVKNMLLLLDESDCFLETISGNGYSELQPLVDLKRESKNSFKFVIAGLHNVCRAKNATENNGIFGQLGEPLCVKPLSPNEALQLISRPLTYLGFQVDRYPHLETILTNTNYYPGILQFFGYTLVQTMTQHYGRYYRAVDGNPPYSLHKEQLGAIMNSADLNSSIKEKFRLSLKLDQRYFMLARCVAMLYYEHEDQGDTTYSQNGFSVDEIQETANDWGVRILDVPASEMKNLLDEMVDMGILVCPDPLQARYRLRRYSFLNIIGTSIDSLLDDIDLYNKEA